MLLFQNRNKRSIPTQLPDFVSPTVNTYSIETVVAEKIDAVLTLMEFSSRMKDYYDIYYIANKFDFDGQVLSEALRETFANRNHLFTVEQFKQVMNFGNDATMQKKWKAFTHKINTKTDDYSAVLNTIKVFLAAPFMSAVESTKYTKQWSASSCEWI